MSWNYTKDVLPVDGKYVIAKHSRGTWKDSDDQKNVNTVIVKLVKGLTAIERENLPEDDPRKRIYKAEDEGSNNLKGYCWRGFGTSNFFGQDIICWTDIPDSTDDMNPVYRRPEMGADQKKFWKDISASYENDLVFGNRNKKNDTKR